MTPPFYNDEPTVDDRLGHAPYAAALARLCRTCKPPFVVGVYGGWGVGKTSLLRQVERELNRPGDGPSVASVWFSPWRHQFEDSPVVALLQQIAGELADGSCRRLRLFRMIGTLTGEALLSAATGGRVAIADIARRGAAWERQYFAVRSLTRRLREALAEDVARLLEHRGASRLVILIDDLDRCRSEPALKILESLKIFLNAANCVYLLGLDPERIAVSLPGGRPDDPDEAAAYLEKLVQLPFRIPPPAPECLEAFAGELLPPDYEPELARLVAVGIGDNPRNLKRFVNSAILWEPLLRDRVKQVYSRALHLRLRLIQFRAPRRYQALVHDPRLLADALTVLAGIRSLEDYDVRRAAELRRWVEEEPLAGILRAAPTLDSIDLASLASYLPLLPARWSEAEPPLVRWRPLLVGLADGGERAILVRDSVANAWLPSDVHLARLPALRGVDLRGADLRDADLYQVDLREADLRSADLRGAMLAGANLDGALLAGARFEDADLDDVNWPEGFQP